jgi:hypothetical protein
LGTIVCQRWPALHLLLLLSANRRYACCAGGTVAKFFLHSAETGVKPRVALRPAYHRLALETPFN